MATIVESLTKDIVERDLRKEGANLIKKWEKTGLLEGLSDDRVKNTMSVLLENQAKELLREASSMSAGDVEGFAAVAFPIVRRVFGGLIANELVSVQPMSLPSGLIFFLDFTFSTDAIDGAFGSAQYGKSYAGVSGSARQSLYGGGVVGSQITGGVNLTGLNAERGFYALNNGWAGTSGSTTTLASQVAIATPNDFNASYGDTTALSGKTLTTITASDTLYATILGYDADEAANAATTTYSVIKVPLTQLTGAGGFAFDTNNLVALNVISGTTTSDIIAGGQQPIVVRRLTRLDATKTSVLITLKSDTASTTPLVSNSSLSGKVGSFIFAVKDQFSTSGTSSGLSVLELLAAEGEGSGSVGPGLGTTGGNVTIPEIDIKVDSIAVTAQTKKLKAKWTPELAQDLNAYHNLDAEVELTGILSEQIALEIDQEILNDLVKGATAGTLYWSRRPGKFVNRETGASISSAVAPPDFTGNVSEWYETLVETMNDVSARIHRKTLRGGANFVVCSPEVANVLEFTSGFRASISAEELKGNSVGAVKVGSMSKKWDVYVDPYFPRNVVLIGRRGKAFLESGYVYAPYVPLQVTPTIFGVEDFVPRKGVMTRYAKKMVRPDMYGLVIVEDLLG
jgi:Major capsid protein Gp23